MRRKKQHLVDFLFPLILFFLFTVTALMVLLMAARIYQTSVEQSSRTDTARTCLSYLSEKLHQGDREDSVSLGTFDGCDALILKQTYNDDTYYTYIYPYNDTLNELFVKEGANATAKNGKKIVDIDSFSMELRSEHLIRFYCKDKSGHSASLLVGLQTEIDSHTRKDFISYDSEK